jgi:hypothetical protein
MAWSPSNPPVRGGSYSRFITKRQETLPPSTRGTVAIPITHDWGPFKQFVRVNSLAEFVAIFGKGGDSLPAGQYTPGYLAAYNAFRGENTDAPGAATVLVYRTGAASAAKASRAMQNTTPATAFTLTAVYEGTKGNNLKVEVLANAANPATQKDLVIYDGTVEVERFTHTNTGLQDLVTAINRSSGWVRATDPPTIPGVALANVAATNLAGGADGSTLIAGDWTALQTAFESQRFEVFAPYNLTDDTIKQALITWAKAKNNAEKAKRFMLVLGGGAAETMSQAITSATGANDENVVRLGVGTFKDVDLGYVQSTAELAPRLAGVIVQRGYDASISFAHLAGLEIVTGPSEVEILDAVKNGVVVLGQDSAGVRFEKGVTTYVSDIADKPKYVYGNIKYAFTMQSFERTLQERHEGGNIVGRLDVNNDTREFLVGDGQALLDQEYIKYGAVQAGARVVLAANPPPSDDQDFVALDWLAKFGRSLEQVRNTFYLS